MLALEIRLVLLGVDQRGLRLCVAHERLEFIQGHTAAQAGGRERVPEFVWEDMMLAAPADFTDLSLDGPDAQAMVRASDGHEECLAIVLPGLQILPEREF